MVENALPAAIGLLGMYVLVGWATGTESMVRIAANSVAMGINAAVLFVVAALALRRHAQEAKVSQRASVLNWFLIALPIASLFENATGIALGIDWSSLHASIKDGNPSPGRLAPNSCIGFLFAGLAMLGLSKRELTVWQGRALVFCAYATLAVGISGLIGYALNLDIMYRFAVYNSMALPTAVGLSLLGIALWRALRTRAEREGELPVGADIRITKTAIVVLTVVALVTGLTGFFVLKHGFEESMSVTVLRNAKNHSAAFASAIDQQLILDDIIAARPGIQNGLFDLEMDPGNPKIVALLGEIGRSFSGFGLTGYQLFDSKGELVVDIGTMVAARAEMNMALPRPAHRAQLLWQDGFVLRNTRSVLRKGRQVGLFIAEHRLAGLTAAIREMSAETASTDILVCGRDQNTALCFPSKFYKANLRIPMYKDGKPHLAISRALLGENGMLSVRDLRGIQVLAGYAPIGTLGLGLVHKTDAMELYLPVRQRLNLFVGVLVLLVAMGTFMLRAQVQPLARQLLTEQKRTQIILESSHEAYIEMDSSGVISDWNAQAERTFGWGRNEVLGKEMASLIIPLSLRDRHRKGLQRFLETGESSVIGKRMELPTLHRDGRVFSVEITISIIDDKGKYIFTAFLHDISERKAAEEKLLDSERRLAQLARFDTLTGLPNRFQLNEKLDEATQRRQRLGTPLAVMFLDIDHFKQINDTLGHAAGDIVLKEFAARLKSCLRATDFAGRLAGDEFVIFMEAPHGVDEPSVVAKKIIEEMQRPWQVEGHDLSVTTSMGIAFACGEMLSANALLAKADSALYRAKKEGRNRFIVQTC